MLGHNGIKRAVGGQRICDDLLAGAGVPVANHFHDFETIDVLQNAHHAKTAIPVCRVTGQAIDHQDFSRRHPQGYPSRSALSVHQGPFWLSLICTTLSVSSTLSNGTSTVPSARGPANDWLERGRVYGNESDRVISSGDEIIDSRDLRSAFVAHGYDGEFFQSWPHFLLVRAHALADWIA